jgi:hypothetical protein
MQTEPSTEPTASPVDDDEIRRVVERLSRPHPSGGSVIERAAILAEGAKSAAIMEWITTREWQPEEDAPAVSGRGSLGLHARERDRSNRPAPRRYVLRPAPAQPGGQASR